MLWAVAALFNAHKRMLHKQTFSKLEPMELKRNATYMAQAFFSQNFNYEAYII
jgi:hypothetical protein